MNVTSTTTCQLLRRGRVRITLEPVTVTGVRNTNTLSAHNEGRSVGPSYCRNGDMEQAKPAWACLPLRRVFAAAVNADSIASEGMHGLPSRSHRPPCHSTLAICS